jgi:hypothetical protein
MAGYSGTPLAKKLGIKAGHQVLAGRAPEGFAAALEPLPEDVKIATRMAPNATYDVIVFFTTRRLELEKAFATLRPRLAANGGFWVAWPKKSSGRASELDENVVRALGLSTGLVDNKVCAMDDVWSGLRFVIRLADR